MNFWRKQSHAPNRPEPVVPTPADDTLPLKDAFLRGWFRNDTGELYEGFKIGPDDVVADIGCGNGGHAAFCARQGASVILVDLEPVTVAETAARIAEIPGHGRIEFHASDSDPLPIADASCSRIICSEVVEHVDAPERLMRELVRIGKPGAQYLFTCPDPGSEALQQKLAPPGYWAKPFHLRILSHEDLDRLVQGAGLTIERRHSYGFYWNLWLVLYRACNLPMDKPEHPLLDAWTRTWDALLELPEGLRIKTIMDDMLPRSQLVIARKPERQEPEKKTSFLKCRLSLRNRKRA